MLGPGNRAAAMEALKAYPGGLQIGGGITAENASEFLTAGASHVIVTSWIFDQEGKLLRERLDELVSAVGSERLVIDLSCRRTQEGWSVAMNRWKTITEMVINEKTLNFFAQYCAEFLIHAADVEGKCSGMDEDLIQLLGSWAGIRITYAGGASSLEDLQQVEDLSGGNVDLTIGSALDIFGGTGVTYADCVAWNRRA